MDFAAIENIIVLLLVASAVIYAAVRLRRVAQGHSKCACGSDSCPTSRPVGQLPIVRSNCDPGSCGQDGEKA